MAHAIITGDVIHSTKMSIEHRGWLFKQITQLLKQLNKDFGVRSETFRGDSFQCYIKNPAEALKIALIQKTFIRSLYPEDLFTDSKKTDSSTQNIVILSSGIIDARIAIGIGGVDLLSNKLASSGGRAFELSGQLLDKMKSKKQSIAIATDDPFNEELQTEFILLNAIISKTTALQCEVMNHKLLGYTETEIADKLTIMQSAVNQRSNGGNWNAIEAMIKRFEKIYSYEK